MGEIYTVWSVIARHKVILAILAFVLLVGFVDENSYYRRMQHQKTIAELRENISAQRARYARDSVALHLLETSREEVVRVAREDYYMLRDNEDLFVVRADSLYKPLRSEAAK